MKNSSTMGKSRGVKILLKSSYGPPPFTLPSPLVIWFWHPVFHIEFISTSKTMNSLWFHKVRIKNVRNSLNFKSYLKPHLHQNESIHVQISIQWCWKVLCLNYWTWIYMWFSRFFPLKDVIIFLSDLWTVI